MLILHKLEMTSMSGSVNNACLQERNAIVEEWRKKDCAHHLHHQWSTIQITNVALLLKNLKVNNNNNEYCIVGALNFLLLDFKHVGA